MPRAGHIIGRPRGLLASSRRKHGFSGERVRFKVAGQYATATPLVCYNVDDGTVRALRAGEVFWLMDLQYQSPAEIVAWTFYLFDDHDDDGVVDAANIVIGIFSTIAGAAQGHQFNVPPPMFNPKVIGGTAGRFIIGRGVVRSV